MLADALNIRKSMDAPTEYGRLYKSVPIHRKTKAASKLLINYI
jgi:hypothetical protein